MIRLPRLSEWLVLELVYNLLVFPLSTTECSVLDGVVSVVHDQSPTTQRVVSPRQYDGGRGHHVGVQTHRGHHPRHVQFWGHTGHRG